MNEFAQMLGSAMAQTNDMTAMLIVTMNPKGEVQVFAHSQNGPANLLLLSCVGEKHLKECLAKDMTQQKPDLKVVEPN
jgi:hypothetical protein